MEDKLKQILELLSGMHITDHLKFYLEVKKHLESRIRAIDEEVSMAKKHYQEIQNTN